MKRLAATLDQDHVGMNVSIALMDLRQNDMPLDLVQRLNDEAGGEPLPMPLLVFFPKGAKQKCVTYHGELSFQGLHSFVLQFEEEERRAPNNHLFPLQDVL